MPFSDLPRRVEEITSRIRSSISRGGHGQSVRIVAVTKTFGPDAVAAAYHAGLEIVGENKVQEALAKMDQVRLPIAWHLIGHLQRNKARAATRFALVHSLDSGRLADALDRIGRGAAIDGRGGERDDGATPIPVLMQVNVAGESTKGGYLTPYVPAEAERLRALSGIRVEGVMVMAPLGAEERELRGVFAGGRTAREMLRAAGHPATELSMGMSSDYEIAVEEGATLVRLGTILFGARGGAA
jgi:pyridoxal phosphate enzyme (YggS family)